LQRDVLLAIGEGVKGVAETLRTASTAETGTSNQLGDKQLVADIEADNKIMDALRRCPSVALASSEEDPRDIQLNENGTYGIAFDPLDGSSIIAAGWAVGSIFGVYPGNGFLNRSGRDLKAAAYALYGPRTILVIARPKNQVTSAAEKNDKAAEKNNSKAILQEFALINDEWVLQRDEIRIPESKKIFAPANLRCAADNKAYSDLVSDWMSQRYTLRYSGGLVPDVHHIVSKGGGVFCNPASSAAPAKLRVLYECLPLAFCIEAAGGASLGAGGVGSALDHTLVGHDDRSGICLGSAAEVEKCRAAMQEKC
jgi:sedoheptulose-bisphosphatase